jgi:hypothetical protein
MECCHVGVEDVREIAGHALVDVGAVLGDAEPAA